MLQCNGWHFAPAVLNIGETGSDTFVSHYMKSNTQSLTQVL